MKILLLGKNGQLGWELQRSLAPVGEVVALGSDSVNPCGNLANLTGIRETIRATAPDIIVNAAAYTAVDQAESEREKAALINAKAPAALAQEARLSGALLVHYSTDYVFDGSGNTPWQETDSPAPVNFYGATKLDGEKAIQASGCRYYIFRTSWVYAARGNNFVKTILRLAKERDSLRIVNDQIGAPTGAELLADITAHILRSRPEACGLYHLSASGETSWYDYARFVLDYARQAGVNLKVSEEAVTAIPSSDFQLPAKRPLNSRLDTGKFTQTFGLHLPDWQSGVEQMLAEIL
ncbi:MAG: dTDP-4-dehydrorhamnose reductase [Alphaproteobacteria bacterium]|nr:dTDP-4-dehydrorhamnose reductase [Alphaproteobacteria bacterium]